jgi:hypothetical protein
LALALADNERCCRSAVLQSRAAVVLGQMAKRSAFVFLVYVILGACIAVVLHKVCASFNNLNVSSLDRGIDLNSARNSWRWLALYAATVGLFGMIQGVVSGWGLVRMFALDGDRQVPPPNRGLPLTGDDDG